MRAFRFYDEGIRSIPTPAFCRPCVDDCDLENVLISEGCQLCRAEVHEAVIGVRSIIGCNTADPQDADDGRGLLRQDEHDRSQRQAIRIPLGIGEGCQIEGAILDKNVRIGDNVTIRPHERGEDQGLPSGCPRGEEMYVIRDGIVVIPKNTEIPEGTVI